MDEFFDFAIWCAREFATFLLGLPFASGFTFGHALIAVTILGILIVALVGTLRVANLAPEARKGGSS